MRLLIVTLIFIISELHYSDSSPNPHHFSIKCPLGNFYYDGCTVCECDIPTGETQCTKTACYDMSRECPQGPKFKDQNGNKCSCYSDTGAVYCSIVKIKPPSKKAVAKHHPSLSLKRKSFLKSKYYPVSSELTAAQKDFMQELIRSYVES